MISQFRYIPIENLQRGKYQPRKHFDPVLLKELSQSIAEQGLIEPLVVRQIGPHQYEIIAGERRWRAAMEVGFTELPCVLGTYTDTQAATVALVENIQREDLNLIEEAEGYQRLINEFNFHQEEIGQLVGKSRSHIANLLRLLSLCAPVQNLIRQGKLSLGHARMLVGLPNKAQENLAKKIETHTWSVRRLEKEVRSLKTIREEGEAEQDIIFLQNQISMQLNAPVEISKELKGGWLKIKFYDNDTLLGLMQRMGLQTEEI
ncbi:partition protein ParB (plasmid) [Legionella adelaidensis]|uniref:Probable chromosome-partitioning protein ParB n=1 Tax=Legionella adelaidensis TaxID=45056 RepID=A0A0W0R5N3_9GAMM|nr:ParB/RepB/Spo0J family partition protein [Legionella adelaidensis]KTC66417.1 partition protein ParB [Legionella adelaidensis]VEH85015.1 partition protein ParB [Legionella adelaidensis]